MQQPSLYHTKLSQHVLVHSNITMITTQDPHDYHAAPLLYNTKLSQHVLVV